MSLTVSAEQGAGAQLPPRVSALIGVGVIEFSVPAALPVGRQWLSFIVRRQLAHFLRDDANTFTPFVKADWAHALEDRLILEPLQRSGRCSPNKITGAYPAIMFQFQFKPDAANRGFAGQLSLFAYSRFGLFARSLILVVSPRQPHLRLPT